MKINGILVCKRRTGSNFFSFHFNCFSLLFDDELLFVVLRLGIKYCHIARVKVTACEKAILYNVTVFYYSFSDQKEGSVLYNWFILCVSFEAPPFAWGNFSSPRKPRVQLDSVRRIENKT